MNAAMFSAAAVLASSAVGGVTSKLSTLFAQRAQVRAQRIAEQKSKLENLYGDFIEETSRLHTNALTHDSPQLTAFVGIYAKISKMRYMSSPEVIASAQGIFRAIVETYTGPNREMTQLRAATNQDTPDPLRSFSNVCRAELRDLSFVHESERSAVPKPRAFRGRRNPGIVHERRRTGEAPN
jgi:hypothetical protein